jgi:hypothetical protein
LHEFGFLWDDIYDLVMKVEKYVFPRGIIEYIGMNLGGGITPKISLSVPK